MKIKQEIAIAKKIINKKLCNSQVHIKELTELGMSFVFLVKNELINIIIKIDRNM